MSSSPVVNPVVPLPRDIDVEITISRPSSEVATDMSLAAFLTPEAVALPPNNGRVVVSSDIDSLLDEVGAAPGDSISRAVQTWAAQLPKAARFAIGRIFAEPVPAQLMAPIISNYGPINEVADGSFEVNVFDADGAVETIDVTGIDLTAATTVDAIAFAINTAIEAAGAEDKIEVSALYGNHLVITALGDYTSISYLSNSQTGTDISDILGFSQESGAQKWDYYEPQGLVAETKLVREAFAAIGSPSFCLHLDRVYRDTQDQKDFADYVESNQFKLAAVLETNSPTAYDSADTTNIGKYVYSKQYKSVTVVYSSYQSEYPGVAYPQELLATDYAAEDSTKTAKFKATGITPEQLTETQLQVLKRYNINVFTVSGNDARFFREGTQAAQTWWTDSYYGWCNLREELQVAVMNGLRRRPKTPLTTKGQAQVVDDIGDIMDRYVFNGFLSNREEAAPELNDPHVTLKAFTIKPSPVYFSDRATRTLSPIYIQAFESGAIHKAVINIDAVN